VPVSDGTQGVLADSPGRDDECVSQRAIDGATVTALHDRIDDAGLTLLKLGATDADTGELEQALRDTGAPLVVHELAEPSLRQVYGADLFLLRPDLHVAWRSYAPPEDLTQLAAVLTGR
jgi:hypothetical protein